MPLTFKQINDLDNSMVAAQQVSLGQVLNFLSGSSSASSVFIPTATSTVIATGMTTVGLAIVAFSGSTSGSTHTYTTVSGCANGSIIVKTWYLSGSTLVVGAAPFNMVTWRAYGT